MTENLRHENCHVDCQKNHTFTLTCYCIHEQKNTQIMWKWPFLLFFQTDSIKISIKYYFTLYFQFIFIIYEWFNKLFVLQFKTVSISAFRTVMILILATLKFVIQCPSSHNFTAIQHFPANFVYVIFNKRWFELRFAQSVHSFINNSFSR